VPPNPWKARYQISEKVQTRLRLALDKADKLKALIGLYADFIVEEQQPHLFSAPTTTAMVSQPPPTSSPSVRAGEVRVSKATLVKVEVTDLVSKRGTEHRQKILEHLGRVDGFHPHQNACETDNGVVAGRGLLASHRDASESLQFAYRLFDPGARPV
jgi:hypothetical protein